MILRKNQLHGMRSQMQLGVLTKLVGILVISFAISACESNEEAVAGPTGSNPPPPTTPPPTPPPPTPPPPPPSATDQQIFEATLYPLLMAQANFCVTCHGASQDPQFAVADATVAYTAITSQQKVNLSNPSISRVYVRPKDERHNCGGDASCDQIADAFLAAIQDWAAQATAAAPPPVGGGQPVISAVTTFADATSGGQARADGAAIALFTFSEGAGDVTTDSSGVGTPITLQISGMEWVDGGGLRNVTGKAQADAASSRKLFDMITPANAYSVEAWIIPDNNAQDGPARIVSYSQDTAIRNFTLGQNAIYYQLRNRTAGSGANGTPAVEALDPQVDTALTHVVATFDGDTGRKIYINGQLSIEENVAGDALAWQDDQPFVLGNEATDDRPWAGVLQLVAIHNKALTDVEVRQNFDAGAGNIFTMRFDVSNVIGEPAFIDMQAAQLDAAGYLFARPVYVSDATSIAIKNIRVAVNDTVPVAAQPFRRIDTVVLQSGEELSPLGAVVPVQLGADTDQFHLEFEVLGNMLGLAETTPPSAPPMPAPDIVDSEYGLRTFSQLNDAMSSVTGVDPSTNAVLSTYTDVLGSLPSSVDPLAFAPAQQLAIQRLAVSYCGVVVGDNNSCNDLFGNCAVDANAKDQVATALYDRFIGDNIASQPDRAGVTTEIVQVIDDLGCANGCAGAEGEIVLQATCAAVLSSAVITVN